MATPGEEPEGRRLALVVATGTYADTTLSALRAPGSDATRFADVLRDEAVGRFEVETVLDAPADALRRQVARFCAASGPRDLALVYLSCHGILDDRGRLYYATTDTDRTLLAATAIPAAWLNEQLDDCRARRQVVVLDCCHSGAFAKGAKGEAGLALRERFEGRGRVVLTASRGTEYAFEGDHVVGDAASSVFTGVLVDGLRSGEADRDGDGIVTVAELYDHAYEAVRARDARQTPTLWTYGAEGELLVAHSPRGPVVEPEPLPDELVELLESSRPRLRESAVGELADLVAGPDQGRALTARLRLERVAAEDIPQVAAAARAALGTAPPPGPPAAPPTAPARPPPPPPAGPAGPPPARRRPDRRLLLGVALVALVVVGGAVALLAGGGSGARDVPAGAIAVDGQPRGLAAGEGALWVARHDDGQVSRIDTAAGTTSIDVGDAPDRIAAGEGAVWVTVGDGTALRRIDPQTREVAAPVGVDLRQGDCSCPPGELVIDDGSLWAAAPKEGVVYRRDLATGKEVEAEYRPGQGFTGQFALDDTYLWAVGHREGDEPAAYLARFDLDSGERKVFRFEATSDFSGVAYGEGAVWIADAGDAHNALTSFDPRTEGTSSTKLADGVTGDDLVVAAQKVLFWEPDAGVLTTVDEETGKVESTQRLPEYTTGQNENERYGDLSVAQGSAWITDPAAGLVRKLDL